MAKRTVILLLIVVVVAAAGSYAYHHYRTDRRLNGGEVVSAESGKVVTEDGNAPIATPTRSETPEAQPMPATPAPQPVTSSTTAPTVDTIPHDPPDRAAFAGTGKFQIYRQGDLTWRLNTDDGKTCILFATMDQWRKPIVYRNACPTR